MGQPFLFDRQNPELDRATPWETHRADIGKELARLKGSRGRILARLREGPATNAELSTIALRFGARLMELREAGCQIQDECAGGGLWVYTLTGEPR